MNETYVFSLCRVSRKTVLDEDLLIRVPHPQAVSLADTIIKAGIHQYPESEFLLIVQTGLRIYLKNDKPVRSLAVCCAVLCCAVLCCAVPGVFLMAYTKAVGSAKTA